MPFVLPQVNLVTYELSRNISRSTASTRCKHIHTVIINTPYDTCDGYYTQCNGYYTQQLGILIIGSIFLNVSAQNRKKNMFFGYNTQLLGIKPSWLGVENAPFKKKPKPSYFLA